MNVAVLSYPMLFQALGGLQVQVLETIAALQRQGCNARLVDPTRERLDSFDLVHVYAVINGNHRIVERARSLGVPVVLSPLVRPYWTRRLARRADLVDRVMGRATAWTVGSEYRQILSGLQAADRCVALGTVEKIALQQAFGIAAERIDVVPNGIPARFFEADPAPFLRAHGLQPGFVLCVAAINPHKNQLGLANALRGSGHTLVLVGECPADQQDYLQQLLALPHVRHVGAMAYDDPLLPSAYAAAGVMALVSQSEVMPLSVLESLAAGRPAVMTRHHCMDDLGADGCILEIEPSDEAAILAAISALTTNPPNQDRCRTAVRSLTWDDVAGRLLETFRAAIESAEQCRTRTKSIPAR
jgi:hypothetical protein